jgi:hypothetical protein
MMFTLRHRVRITTNIEKGTNRTRNVRLRPPCLLSNRYNNPSDVAAIHKCHRQLLERDAASIQQERYKMRKNNGVRIWSWVLKVLYRYRQYFFTSYKNGQVWGRRDGRNFRRE